MHALRKSHLMLVDADRFGRLDADDARLARTRRRGIVNTFLAERSYWALMRWLAAKMPTHRRFLTIGEALALARFEYDRDPSEERKMVVVVARYFNLAGRAWL